MTFDSQAVEKQLNRHGEIIVFTDAGQKFELHKSDVEFKGGSMRWTTGDEVWMVDSESVESILVHSSHKIE